jgi:hypothetical protein
MGNRLMAQRRELGYGNKLTDDKYIITLKSISIELNPKGFED